MKLVALAPPRDLKLLISRVWLLVRGVPNTRRKEVRLVRAIVAGLIIAIVCLVTYAVTSIQNSW
jgi:hypothetical protein